MATAHNLQVKTTPSSGYVYLRLSNEPVGFTAEVAPGIVVDYDPSGAVRGIEAESQLTLDKLGIAKIVELALLEKDRAPSGSESDGPD